MGTLEEVRARVERFGRENLTEREATPHPNSLAVPMERDKAAGRLRLLGEYQAAIGSGHTIVLKVAARVEDCRERRATSHSASGIMARRSETAPEAERPHWGVAADWLLGRVGGNEVPGGVVAMCTELGVERLQPVPNLDAELERLEADLAEHVARLVSHLDAWDREHATVTPR